MNLPGNRPSESPHPSGKQPPDDSRSSPPLKIPPPEKSPTSSGATSSESTDEVNAASLVVPGGNPATSSTPIAHGGNPSGGVGSSTETAKTRERVAGVPPVVATPAGVAPQDHTTVDSLSPRERQQPIPPPSNPKQYRAIGLIQGQYQRSAEQMTRGVLLTLDGTAIEAVLLGRVISLVKNHINLEQPHLWVVYPRIRQDDDHLHMQIVGVWEPETLSQGQPTSTDVQSEAVAPLTSVETGYFSVRGEVIYTSSEKETVIVKIRQSPKQESEKPKFFKLKLKGTLPDKPVGHFWDLQVHLEADTLVIQEATDLGLLPKKKPFLKSRGQRFSGQRDQRPLPADSPPLPKGKPVQEKKPSPNRPPLPKPVKGNPKKT